LVQSWHRDIQTGAGKDALLLRPGLAAALKEARAARSHSLSRGSTTCPRESGFTQNSLQSSTNLSGDVLRRHDNV
jgi:hypothetical protein